MTTADVAIELFTRETDLQWKIEWGHG